MIILSTYLLLISLYKKYRGELFQLAPYNKKSHLDLSLTCRCRKYVNRQHCSFYMRDGSKQYLTVSSLPSCLSRSTRRYTLSFHCVFIMPSFISTLFHEASSLEAS